MSKPAGRGKAIAVVVAIALITTASVVYMVARSVKSGTALEYFKEVDQAVAELPRLKGRRLRLHGNVVKGTIQKKPGTLEYRFAVFSNDKWVEVSYTGLVPDTFKDCAEVVVKGVFNANGSSFAADHVSAKCPSKYDEQQRLSGCGESHQPQVLAARSGT